MMDEDYEFIWLKPSCDKCYYSDRTWCQENVYEPCEECGRKASKYKLEKVEDE